MYFFPIALFAFHLYDTNVLSLVRYKPTNWTELLRPTPTKDWKEVDLRVGWQTTEKLELNLAVLVHEKPQLIINFMSSDQ